MCNSQAAQAAGAPATRDRLPALIATFRALKAQSAAERAPFKVRAYGKLLDQLERIATPIASPEDLAAVGLTGVGESMRATIDAVFASPTGTVTLAPRLSAIEALTSVTSIGPVKAQRLVDEAGVESVADLRAKHAAGAVSLNEKELLGLKHWEDFLLKVPRAEIDRHRATLERALSEVDRRGASVTIMGSYRRGATESGDIDAIVSGPDAPAIMAAMATKLTADGYLLPGNFGSGKKKVLAICRLPDVPHSRRLDLLAVPAEELAFSLLYFTGSKNYNIRVRNAAKAAGYSLSERGLRPTDDAAAARLNAHLAEAGAFKTEKDVLDFLGMPFVAPELRL